MASEGDTTPRAPSLEQPKASAASEETGQTAKAIEEQQGTETSESIEAGPVDEASEDAQDAEPLSDSHAEALIESSQEKENLASQSELPSEPLGSQDVSVHENQQEAEQQSSSSSTMTLESQGIAEETSDITSTLSEPSQSPLQKIHHSRVDSVPPQRYEIEDANESAFDPDLLSPPAEEQESEDEEIESQEIQFQRFRDEALFFGAGHAMCKITSYMSSDVEVDRSGLSFVDVRLDGDGVPSGSQSPYLSSTFAKSSEQIRKDSISSADPLPQEPASHPSPSESEVSNLSGPSIRRLASVGKFESPLTSPVVESFRRSSFAEAPRRSVEGRYRGRKSRPTSRAASPETRGSAVYEDEAGHSRSRRNSYVGNTSTAKKRMSNSSISSTGSSAAGTWSRRVSGNNLSGSGRMELSIDTKDVGGITMMVAGEDSSDLQVVEEMSISPSTIRPVDVEETKPKAAEANGLRGSKTTQGLEEECQEDQSEKQPTPEVPARSSSKAETDSKLSPASPSKTSPVAAALAVPETPTSPGLSDKADESAEQRQRRRSSSQNADSLESRTRMTTLPPKQKSEEIKHRVDFEKMMMQHKELERKRKEEEEERRRKREQEQRDSLVKWEKEILPSWTRARKDEELAELWWKGAPPSIRGRVWALAIGNAMMLPRNLLKQAEKRSRKIPENVLKLIDEDIADTLPSLKLFQNQTGPLYDELLRICKAYVLVRMEQVDEMTAAGDADRKAACMQAAKSLDLSPKPLQEGGEEEDEDSYAQRGIELYQKGVSTLAAILLINLPTSTAFICLLNLISSKPWLKALHSLSPTTGSTLDVKSRTLHGSAASNQSPKEKEIRCFERVFETLLADQMPKVYANLLTRNVDLNRLCLRDWVGQLWGKWLDCDTVMRLWDVVLLDDTDSMIYRTTLALVQTLESRLYVPDKLELESVLLGDNKAALSIWRREKELSGQGELELPQDYIYEQYGIREETIFLALEDQKAWWKQSTLTRLLDRELGD